VRAGPQKYIACNADEGDSGTFADRLLMEGDPFCLIEGMAIAGLAVGATQGYIYVRSEYPHAIAVLNEAIARASAAGWLGGNVAGSGKAFYLQVRKGPAAMSAAKRPPCWRASKASAALCAPSRRCPIEGLFGKPTVINNVITLATVPIILARARPSIRAMAWAARAARCRSSWPAILRRRPGGKPGLALRELVQDFGGGTASGRPVKAIQVGGPLGAMWRPRTGMSAGLRSLCRQGQCGGPRRLVVHDDSADMAQLARYAMEFCAIESCGKCTPCRIGSTRGVE
jgi:formate dehydrogenase iron-sulfur subunit